ncbi:unnamed protein product [Ectocarpus sp. 4 AP-2014]
MGLLTVGKPHSWEHAGEHRKYVAKHGVIQFLNTYNSVKDITNDELLWGDEVRREGWVLYSSYLAWLPLAML